MESIAQATESVLTFTRVLSDCIDRDVAALSTKERERFAYLRDTMHVLPLDALHIIHRERKRRRPITGLELLPYRTWPLEDAQEFWRTT